MSAEKYFSNDYLNEPKTIRVFNGVKYYHVESHLYKKSAEISASQYRTNGGLARVFKLPDREVSFGKYAVYWVSKKKYRNK